MVQMNQVARIRRQWEQAGRPACAHKELDREYYLGSNTGDYVCVTCGETFSGAEADAMRSARKNAT